MSKFVIKIGSELKTYTKFEDIPTTFDHVISFLPEIPEGPHTEEQHEEIGLWEGRLQELMRREYASSN